MIDTPQDKSWKIPIARDYLVAGLVAATPGTLIMIGALIMEFGGCAGNWSSMCGIGAPIGFLILTLGLGFILVAGGGPPFGALFGPDLGYLVMGLCMTAMVAVLHFAIGVGFWKFVQWLKPKL